MNPSPATQSIQRPMVRLFQYLDRYRSGFLLATGASVVNKIFDLMPPFLTAWVIDTVSGNPPFWITRISGLEGIWGKVVFLAILTLLIFGIESFTEWIFKRGFMRLAQQVQHDLRLDAYNRMQEREMAYFEQQRTGNLMAMLNDDVNQLERFLNSVFNEIIQIIILVLFAGWALLHQSLVLGLIGMAPIPFIVVGSLFYQRKVAPYYRQVRETVGELSARLENNISGIAVIKSFTAEDFESQRVSQASGTYREANFQAIRWSSVYVPVIRMFIALGFAGTLLLGSYWVLFEPGRFTIGGLAFFAMMIQRLLWPVTRLGSIFDEYERARASARRIFGLLDSKPAIQSPVQAETPVSLSGAVRFHQVSFGYGGSSDLILQDLDLEIPAGSTIGIAGVTGGGKTTLIKLLYRFYDVNQGRIEVDNTDIATLNIQSLRKQIALVSQEVYLFHGTIRENIAYAMPNQSQASIEEVAQKAELHSFVSSLPDGYDTIIGERGIKLSGGQRQRLSIARALLKNAPILVLDEATSAVDTQTELAIQQNLHTLTQGKTAIIIAHRLSTIRQADQIVVMKEGRIAERGTHDYLLHLEGLYADLWKVQTGALEALK